MTASTPGGVGAYRDPDHKRGAAWLWWLLLLIAAIIIAAIVIALAHHHKSHHASAASTTSTIASSSPARASSSTPGSSLASSTGAMTAGGAPAASQALIGGGGAAPVALPSTATSAAQDGVVLFASASDAIDSDGRQVIAAAAKHIQSTKTTTVTVTGYTDVIAGQTVNAKLSQQRADNVAAALRTLLGNGFTVTAAAKGQADPVASNDTAGGRAQNRRAVIS